MSAVLCALARSMLGLGEAMGAAVEPFAPVDGRVIHRSSKHACAPPVQMLLRVSRHMSGKQWKRRAPPPVARRGGFAGPISWLGPCSGTPECAPLVRSRRADAPLRAIPA